jgi:hypothetical protein
MSDYPPSWQTPSTQSAPIQTAPTQSLTEQPESSQSMTDKASEKANEVAGKATDVANEGKQAAGQVAETAAEHAQEVKDEAVRQARDLIGEAREQLTKQAGQQHQTAVANLRSLSAELGSMADNSTQSGMATELVGQARDRVDSLAGWLDGREPGELLDEVRSYARRRPGMFLVGALAAGVVAGRVTRGAVAAHSSDDQSSTAASLPQASITGADGDVTGETGYAAGGAYSDPYAQPSTAQGYGTTSTYGDGSESGGQYGGQYGETPGMQPGGSQYGGSPYAEPQPTQNLPADGAWR